MCAEKVILGIPADILSSEAELEACWKVGGTANLPNGFTLTPDQVSCKYCRAEQSLVIQVCLPPAANEVHRVVLVFGCTQGGCGKQPGSWRAYSIELQSSEHACNQASSNEASGPSAGHFPAKREDKADKWPSDEHETRCSNWGTETEGSPWGTDIDSASSWGCEISKAGLGYSELASQLNSVMHLSERSSYCCTQQGRVEQPKMKNAVADTSNTSKDVRLGSLPCFQLDIIRESDVAATGLGSLATEQQHVDNLVETYWAANPEQLHGSETHETWSGEHYEKGSVDNVSTAFLNFKKGIDRRPDQCIRFGGHPLWPQKGFPEVHYGQTCSSCGGRLHYELQLMSPLIALLEESAQWSGWQTSRKMHDWEWLTVAVYMCTGACKGQKVMEGAVLVVNE